MCQVVSICFNNRVTTDIKFFFNSIFFQWKRGSYLQSYALLYCVKSSLLPLLLLLLNTIWILSGKWDKWSPFPSKNNSINLCLNKIRWLSYVLLGFQLIFLALKNCKLEIGLGFRNWSWNRRRTELFSPR